MQRKDGSVIVFVTVVRRKTACGSNSLDESPVKADIRYAGDLQLCLGETQATRIVLRIESVGDAG